jgi:hypothetical protein
MSNFQYGDELEREANDQIRDSLTEIRNLLRNGFMNQRQACPDICEYLSKRPDLKSEFRDLWELCGYCQT